MSSAGQIVGGIVGAVIGFFVGGPAGALKGAWVGMTLGGVIDPPKGPTIRGPRLDDLSVQTATYGAFIPRVYGTVAIHGNVFWVQGDSLIEREVVTESGKGGSSQTTETFEYFATFAVGLCEGPIDGVRRIWIGDQLWYDAGASDLPSIIASNAVANTFTLYTGTDTQLADPLIQADKGVANVPAYRGLSYIVFDTLPLGNYSNSLMGAQVKVEIVSSGTLSTSLADVGSVTYDPTWHTAMGASGIADLSNNTFHYVVASIGSPWSLYHVKKIGTALNITDTGYSGGGFPLYGASLQTSLYAFYSFVSSRYVSWEYDGIIYTFNTDIPSTTHRFTDALDSAFISTVEGTTDVLFRVPLKDILGAVTSEGVLITQNEKLVLANANCCIAAWGENVVRFWHAIGTTYPLYFEVYGLNGSGDFALIDSFTTSVGAMPYELFSPAAIGHVDGNTLSIFSTDWIMQVDLLAKSLLTARAVTTNMENVIKASLSSMSGLVTLSRLRTIGTSGNLFESNSWALDIITPETVPLSTIVQSECLKSKLLIAADIDVTELTDAVRGYRVAALGAIRAGLDPLRAAWPFDVVQAGYDIKFKKRGSASVATITAGELDAHAAGDSPGVSITDVREMDLILPYKVGVKYLDAAREYDLNEQYAERLNTDAVNESAIDLPIVFTASEAAGKAETLLYLYWLERYDVMLTLPPSYAHLEPGDVITVEATFATYSLRLTSTHHLPDGRVDCRAKYNSASIYTPAAQGSEGLSVGATLSLSGPTVYVLLDIPLLRDDDDTAGFPVAMTGYLTGWPGGVLFRSEDGGETWLDLAGFISPGTVMGYATNSLAAHGGTVYDFASTLTVRLYQGTLSSITEAQLFAAQNWFAYGKDGRWEIIAAKTATLQGDGSYILQDFLRGQLGTEWASGLHVANDSFVRLSAADLEFVSVNASTIGSARNYRGITAGKALDTDSNRAFTYNGVNLECLSPVHATGDRHPTSNDWTLTWVRRTRFAGWRNYVDAALGETTESYEVDVYSSSAYTTVLRTLTSATQTVAYTSANQVTDFGSNQATLYLKIYQLSATVGRGYPLTISITR